MATHGVLLGAVVAFAFLYKAERADTDALRAAINTANVKAEEAIKDSHAAAASAEAYAAKLKEANRRKVSGAKGDTACALFADGWRLLAKGADGEAGR